MQIKDSFDTSKRDSQSTQVTPITPESFDLEEYVAYEAEKEECCRQFMEAESGVLVYRRMRVAEVFAADSKDMKKSLEWQLGALKASMAFKADVANFLEPWYGLGTIAAGFGFDYIWEPGLAPAVSGKFESTESLLNADIRPVSETPIGRHTLDMTEYFLDKTKGMLPLSFSDLQSPLNTLSNIIDPNQFFMDFYLNPEKMHKAFDIAADLTIDFTKKQREMIGHCLVKPGHGFTSSLYFDGIGLSDDTVTMMPPQEYKDFAVPAMVKVGNEFGGAVFHSCGNWSNKKADIVKIPNLRMADGAFSLATDPGANPTEGYADTFAHTGVILNVRIVGSAELVEQKVRELWKPGMKLIVVTYCETPEEQAKVYDVIHRVCKA
ncbi:MAG: uroporphyrinogen decarboxylase family protein [Prevotellaceae bacterium]|nr:uroporphyrinogen decarboxylase family protein [Prevotellaceae bacterium]